MSISEAMTTAGKRIVNRETYRGALVINFVAFLVPAIYATLSKIWIGQIDSSMVVTTEAYVYMSILAEIINEGLPRASYLIIGDLANRTHFDRLTLMLTLVFFQSVLGFVLSIVLIAAAPTFASVFAPPSVFEVSVRYIRISAFSTFFSVIDYSVATATRAADHPDVPLVISLCKTIANIVLDFALLSSFRVPGIIATVETQAYIRLACDFVGSFAGLIFFFSLCFGRHHPNVSAAPPSSPPSSSSASEPLVSDIHPVPKFSLPALKTLAIPGSFTLAESAIRNALYLFLVSGVVALGSDYATAWGVFNTIRWGIVMVPVSTLEATATPFVGHEWGVWTKHEKEEDNRDARDPHREADKVSRRNSLNRVMAPALRSAGIALAIEVLLSIAFVFLIRPFALYINGGNPVVADITELIWRTMGWCYIAYAISTQLSTIFLATWPAWYFLNSILANLLWVLPWAIAVTKINVSQDGAWTYYAVIFGGSLVVSLVIVVVSLVLWRFAVLRKEALRTAFGKAGLSFLF
ncbi:hypothetical protein BJ742DRAFT_815526 [Cladochytrium replicatum]|nr:hypothetical protein BJ742DRAFT_815526 [Cladochytrium replicatum]